MRTEFLINMGNFSTINHTIFLFNLWFAKAQRKVDNCNFTFQRYHNKSLEKDFMKINNIQKM